MMDSAAYFAISPASPAAFPYANASSPALNSLGELDFLVAASASSTSTATTTATATTTSLGQLEHHHQRQSLSTSSSPFNYNSASACSLDDALDPFDQSPNHSNHLHLNLHHHHHLHHLHHQNRHQLDQVQQLEQAHQQQQQQQQQQLYSADYFAEHLCHSAPLGLDRCESPLGSLSLHSHHHSHHLHHQCNPLDGASAVDVCDYLIDDHPSFQSQDNLSFMSAIGGSLSSGGSDCSLSMGNSGAAFDIASSPDDIIISNSIDFYSNYNNNFNDCLPSDMLMTSQQLQQQYTSNSLAAKNGSSGAGADANEYTTTLATTTTTTAASSSATATATANATPAATTPKRSVLMNLLLDGSDIGAGYTSIDSKTTTTPVYFI